MVRLFEYHGRFQGVRGNVLALPLWARFLLTLVALPGLVLVGLSILAFLVSLLALLLTALPAWWLLAAVAGRPTAGPQERTDEPGETTGRRRVDSSVIE